MSTGQPAPQGTSRAQSAYCWARKLMQQDGWCILDTETTGLGAGHQIIDLAIIDKYGEVLLDALIKPSVPISEGALAVHHLSENVLAGAPLFLEVWPSIYDTLTRFEHIYVYNASFDEQMLHQSVAASGLRLFHSQRGADVTMRRRPEGETWTPFVLPVEWQCVMYAYSEGFSSRRRWNGDWQFVSLQAALAQQGLQLGPQQHRALWDCQATLALIKRLAECHELLEQESEASPC